MTKLISTWNIHFELQVINYSNELPQQVTDTKGNWLLLKHIPYCKTTCQKKYKGNFLFFMDDIWLLF